MVSLNCSAAPGAQPVKPSSDLPPELKSWLLKLARTSLDAYVKGEKVPDPADVPAAAKENAGCFVTLTKAGQLRGCIGYIEPIKPLYRAVIENAGNAALQDPRFPEVDKSELTEIKVEVSVLTVPQPLEYKDADDLPNKLVPGKDGIILEKGWAHSTFLPQVWDQLPDKIDFLQHLSLKGGMDMDGWKSAIVKRYYAVHFSE
jgi:uncharacterized protein